MKGSVGRAGGRRGRRGSLGFKTEDQSSEIKIWDRKLRFGI